MALLTLGTVGSAMMPAGQSVSAGRPLDSLPNLRTIMGNAEQDCVNLMRIIERLETMSQMVAGREVLDVLPPQAPANPLQDEGALTLIAHMQYANNDRIERIELLVSAINTRLGG